MSCSKENGEGESNKKHFNCKYFKTNIFKYSSYPKIKFFKGLSINATSLFLRKSLRNSHYISQTRCSQSPVFILDGLLYVILRYRYLPIISMFFLCSCHSLKLFDSRNSNTLLLLWLS